jgi:hypothetical protein
MSRVRRLNIRKGKTLHLGGAKRERFLEAKVGGFPRLEPYNGMIRALIKGKGNDWQKASLLFAPPENKWVKERIRNNRTLPDG